MADTPDDTNQQHSHRKTLAARRERNLPWNYTLPANEVAAAAEMFENTNKTSVQTRLMVYRKHRFVQKSQKSYEITPTLQSAHSLADVYRSNANFYVHVLKLSRPTQCKAPPLPPGKRTWSVRCWCYRARCWNLIWFSFFNYNRYLLTSNII